MNPLSLALVALKWATFALAASGVFYTVGASLFLRRFFGNSAEVAGSSAAADVTILKPLHGAEPSLIQNLQSFLSQHYAGRVQVILGVGSAGDSARPIAAALALESRTIKAEVCIDAREHGRNGKVSNLVNMMAQARHSVIVLSDSDIAVRPGYLASVEKALAAPGVGIVTCPYFGKGAAGFWSDIGAMAISYQFLPNVISGVTLGLAHPCMGSTVALRRETLDRIGGFQAFRNVLADDYAMGEAVRDLGLQSVVAPVLVSHDCVERTFSAMFAHELRWAKTVKGVDPAGHLGSIVTHALPLALLAGLFSDGFTAALFLMALALVARVWLMRTVDGVIGRRLGPWWLLPLRDMLSFVVFVASFFGRSVEWRGAKFHVTNDGDLEPVG